MLLRTHDVSDAHEGVVHCVFGTGAWSTPSANLKNNIASAMMSVAQWRHCVFAQHGDADDNTTKTSRYCGEGNTYVAIETNWDIATKGVVGR